MAQTSRASKNQIYKAKGKYPSMTKGATQTDEMEHGSKGKKMKKIEKVMHEFKEGTLKSSSGKKVKSRKQGIAIAMSEAGMSKKKK